jgi:hypothetical protein
MTRREPLVVTAELLAAPSGLMRGRGPTIRPPARTVDVEIAARAVVCNTRGMTPTARAARDVPDCQLCIRFIERLEDQIDRVMRVQVGRARKIDPDMCHHRVMPLSVHQRDSLRSARPSSHRGLRALRRGVGTGASCSGCWVNG